MVGLAKSGFSGVGMLILVLMALVMPGHEMESTGVVLPLTTSATGLAFAAFYRSIYMKKMKKMIEAELRATAEATQTNLLTLTGQLESQLGEIRERGIARASGSLTPGINGFSAPVFDHTERMVAAITSLGTASQFAMEWDSPLAQEIKRAATTLSRRLGHGTAQTPEKSTKEPATRQRK